MKNSNSMKVANSVVRRFALLGVACERLWSCHFLILCVCLSLSPLGETSENQSLYTQAQAKAHSAPLDAIKLLQTNQQTIDMWPTQHFFDAYFLLIQLQIKVSKNSDNEPIINKLAQRLEKHPEFYPWVAILKAQNRLANNNTEDINQLFDARFTETVTNMPLEIKMWHSYLVAIVLVRESQYAEALRKLTFALESSHLLNQFDVQMLVLGQLVEITYFMGDYTAAIDHSARLLKQAKELQDSHIEVQALTYQMNTFYMLGTDQANLYEDELDPKKKDQIADVFQKYQDKFVELQQLVLDKAEKIGAAQSQVRALVMRQNQYLDSGNFQQAVDVAKQTIAIAEESELLYEAAVSYNNLAIAYRLLKQHQEGIAALSQAAKLYKSLGKQQSLNWVLEDFAIAYELSGQFESALYYYKQFHKASLNTLKKTNSDTVLELEAVLSSREKEREIDALNQRQALREQQQQTERLWVILMMVVLFGAILVLWLRYHKRKRFQALFHQEASLRSQLSEMNEAKTRFFTNISHEFRTSLTLAIGPLKSILNQQDDLNTDHLEAISSALENNLHMMSLLGEVLDINSIKSNETPIFLSKIDLIKSLESCFERFSLMLKEKQVTLKTTGFDAPIELYFDSNHFDKIFTNLLSNSLKYSHAQSVIEVIVLDLPDEVCISVIDQGIGIDAQELPYIFERFYQGKRSSALPSPGTGIGLSFVKELIDLHHGDIYVESAVDQGTKVKVTIKKDTSHYAPGLLEQSDATSAVAVPQNNFSLHNTSANTHNESLHIAMTSEQQDNAQQEEQNELSKIILIVDDNAKVRRLLRNILRNNYQILEAENGRVGLKLAQEIQPDVIISDVMMPVMDGLEFTKEIKSNPHTSHIYLILLTAKTSQEDTLSGLKLGADDYVYKPFDDQELLTRIDNYLVQKQRLSSLLQGQYSQTNERADYSNYLSSKGDEFSRKLDALIDEHLFDSEFDVEQMYSKLQITRSALFRQTKKSYGVSPKQLLKTRRLEAAYQMLKQYDGTVSEVAYAVGFQSLSSFSRAFREHFNAPPTKIDKILA